MEDVASCDEAVLDSAAKVGEGALEWLKGTWLNAVCRPCRRLLHEKRTARIIEVRGER